MKETHEQQKGQCARQTEGQRGTNKRLPKGKDITDRIIEWLKIESWSDFHIKILEWLTHIILEWLTDRVILTYRIMEWLADRISMWLTDKILEWITDCHRVAYW